MVSRQTMMSRQKDGKIIDNVPNRYIDEKYKNLINNIFIHGLKDESSISQILIIKSA